MFRDMIMTLFFVLPSCEEWLSFITACTLIIKMANHQVKMHFQEPIFIAPTCKYRTYIVYVCLYFNLPDICLTFNICSVHYYLISLFLDVFDVF